MASGETPAALTNTAAASGGTGTITYRWQSSTDSQTWTYVPSASTASGPYQPAAQNVTLQTVTYYRREADTPSDSPVYTPAVTITVTPSVAGNLDFVPVAGVVSLSDVDSRTRGLKTREKVAVLDGPTINGTPLYVERAFYYDYRGRLIQTAERNHLGGISRYSTKYDFVGNVLASHESHKVSSTATADTKQTTFTYDPRGRLLTETTSLNGGTAATITYTYNELGQLPGKTREQEYIQQLYMITTHGGGRQIGSILEICRCRR